MLPGPQQWLLGPSPWWDGGFTPQPRGSLQETQRKGGTVWHLPSPKLRRAPRSLSLRTGQDGGGQRVGIPAPANSITSPVHPEPLTSPVHPGSMSSRNPVHPEPLGHRPPENSTGASAPSRLNRTGQAGQRHRQAWTEFETYRGHAGQARPRTPEQTQSHFQGPAAWQGPCAHVAPPHPAERPASTAPQEMSASDVTCSSRRRSPMLVGAQG